MQSQPGCRRAPTPADRRAAQAQIRRGDWAAGERLPSIPAMAEMFGVAKQTVQRTIDQLRVEGLLITKPGSGTYVRGTRRRLNRLSRGRYGAHRGYHADLAARYRQHLTDVGRAPAPPRSPTRSASPTTPSCWSAGTWCAPTTRRSRSARPGSGSRTPPAPSLERLRPSAGRSTRRPRRSSAAGTRPPPTLITARQPSRRRPRSCRSARTRRCCTCCTWPTTTSTASRSRWPRRPGPDR